MRTHLTVWVMAGALLLLPAVANASPKADLLATDKAFSDLSVAQGSHAAFLAYMTDDVRLFEGAHPPLVGKKSAAEYYARLEKLKPKAKARLEWTPLEADASPDGVLGWTRGTWIQTVTRPDGTLQKLTGYYVTEWRRQANGAYKFVLDIGGTD